MRRARLLRGCPTWVWLAATVALLARPAAGDGVSRVELPNGMRALIKPSFSTDVVAVDLLLDVSVLDEPAAQSGIRALTQRLLLRGTELESGEEVVRRLSEVGGFMDTGIGLDYVEVYAIAPADGFEVALGALAEVVRHPAFLPEEVESQKQALIESLRAGARDAFQETYGAFRQELYGSHPYGRTVEGEPGPLASLTRDQITSFHSRCYGPQNVVIAVCGGVSESRAMRAVRRAFGDWPPGPRPSRSSEAPEPLGASELVVRERPVGRLYLVLGFPAPGAGQPGYYPLQVLDSLLSGGSTARLPAEVRDKAGLAYQVSSFYPTLAGQSHLTVYAVTDPENLADAKEALLAVLRGVCREPPPPQEMDQAKRYLAGAYLLGHQRMKDQAYALAWYEILGLGTGFEQVYLESVQAVTPQEVQEAARSVLRRFVLAVTLPGE
jgi:predicted Zn-dependent peptidase